MQSDLSAVTYCQRYSRKNTGGNLPTPSQVTKHGLLRTCPRAVVSGGTSAYLYTANEAVTQPLGSSGRPDSSKWARSWYYTCSVVAGAESEYHAHFPSTGTLCIACGVSFTTPTAPASSRSSTPSYSPPSLSRQASREQVPLKGINSTRT